jgi:uncharacterized phage-associated protein
MVFVSLKREKLLNAMAYFVENTKYCSTIKLFKLLHFLDFEHYRQTGKSVTGLNYEAWRMGPVPDDLWQEIKQPPEDMAKVLDVVVHRNGENDEISRREFKLKSKADRRYFTKRELAIMERLAFYFQDIKADQISRFSHTKKMPWELVYLGEGKPPAPIPYDLALNTAKVIDDMPTIDVEELAYRREVLAEVNSHTK